MTDPVNNSGVLTCLAEAIKQIRQDSPQASPIARECLSVLEAVITKAAEIAATKAKAESAKTVSREAIMAELIRMMEANKPCPTVREYQDYHAKKHGRKPSTSTVSHAMRAKHFLDWRGNSRDAQYRNEYLSAFKSDPTTILKRLMEEADPPIKAKIYAMSEDEQDKLIRKCRRLNRGQKNSKGAAASRILLSLLGES